ncbi:unnamed protein product [Rodentolepis nana]|uniref:Uncharacterized protein n=1 Tax=Rodentolepis nana TaxID=102285 RepID=A0A3P7S0I2_RODNA|nr:unnamed protein product [Rodentolepis nana]
MTPSDYTTHPHPLSPTSSTSTFTNDTGQQTHVSAFLSILPSANVAFQPRLTKIHHQISRHQQQHQRNQRHHKRRNFANTVNNALRTPPEPPLTYASQSHIHHLPINFI